MGNPNRTPWAAFAQDGAINDRKAIHAADVDLAVHTR